MVRVRSQRLSHAHGCDAAGGERERRHHPERDIHAERVGDHPR